MNVIFVLDSCHYLNWTASCISCSRSLLTAWQRSCVKGNVFTGVRHCLSVWGWLHHMHHGIGHMVGYLTLDIPYPPASWAWPTQRPVSTRRDIPYPHLDIPYPLSGHTLPTEIYPTCSLVIPYPLAGRALPALWSYPTHSLVIPYPSRHTLPALWSYSNPFC